MTKRLGILAMVTLLAACSGNGGSPAPQSQPQPQQGPLTLQSQASGTGDTTVTLHASEAAGTIITLVGQLQYDTSRLSMKGCQIGTDIGAGTTAGKNLHFAEVAPGTVRAVVEGGLQALPPAADILTCTFSRVSGAPSGGASIHADVKVADMSFVDRPLSADATVNANN